KYAVPLASRTRFIPSITQSPTRMGLAHDSVFCATWACAPPTRVCISLSALTGGRLLHADSVGGEVVSAVAVSGCSVRIALLIVGVGIVASAAGGGVPGRSGHRHRDVDGMVGVTDQFEWIDRLKCAQLYRRRIVDRDIHFVRRESVDAAAEPGRAAVRIKRQ